MSDGGFVLLYRSLLGHHAFRNDAEAMAFAWLIARASWQPTRVRYKGHVIDLKRGECAISIRDMAEALERPKGWVERLFTRLKNETMIETRLGTDARTAPIVVFVRNYDVFQAKSDMPRTASRTVPETAGETRPGQDPDTEQRKEQGNNSSLAKANSPRARKSASPPMLKPDDVEDQVWTDFVRLRAKQGAPPTPTAIAGISREAAKLGWTLNQALTECCERSWRGFKADWVKQGNGRNGTARNGNGQAGGSGDGFLDGIREARANLAARGRQTDDDRGMPYFGGMG